MTRSDPEALVELLLVEDNPGDAQLVKEALREGTTPFHLTVLSDGEEVLPFLRGEAPYQQAPRPRLVLLDLDLPRKDGRTILREIKADPKLRRLPVVVLTGSPIREDVAKVYDLQGNCFVRKPVNYDDLHRVFRAIEEFWFSVAELPGGVEP